MANAAVFGLASCDLLGGDETPAYEWFRPGARLAYSFRTPTGEPYRPEVPSGNGPSYPEADTALVLEVLEQPDFGPYIGRFQPAWEGGAGGKLIPLLGGLTNWSAEPRRGPEGLSLRHPKSCGTDIFDLTASYDRAIWIPARPRQGAVYRDYDCSGAVDLEHRVAETGLTVETPAGAFEGVFALEREATRYRTAERQYWSEAEGLIKLEKFYRDGTLLGTYELVAKNF